MCGNPAFIHSLGQTPTLRYAGAVSALPQDADVSPKPVEVDIPGQGTIVGINQGWKLSGAIKTAERKLADRTFLHGAGADGMGGEQRTR